MYRNFFKRLIDCALSLAGLVVCGIPMLFIAVMIKTTKGPVIFRQERLGKGEKHFTVYCQPTPLSIVDNRYPVLSPDREDFKQNGKYQDNFLQHSTPLYYLVH